MARDPRLQGRAFSALVSILKEAIPNVVQIRTAAIQVELVGETSWDGGANDQWTSLLAKAAERPALLENLLAYIDGCLKDTIHYKKFLRWSGQGVYAKLDNAISGLRAGKDSLTQTHDPRRSQLSTRTIRLSVIEIKEIVEAIPGKITVDLADREESITARNEILAACMSVINEVDQLTIDVAEARHRSTRIRQEYSGPEVFAAERSILRHLFRDRALIDAESQALLEVIEEQLNYLEIPDSEPGPPGKTAQRPEH